MYKNMFLAALSALLLISCKGNVTDTTDEKISESTHTSVATTSQTTNSNNSFEIGNISGKYVSDEGDLEITISKGVVLFKLLVVSSTGNTGDLEGEMALKGNTGTYKSKSQDCHLQFEFANKQAKVMQEGTCEMGVGVTASGTFKLVVGLDLGVMVGEKYADYCSFSKPEDDKAFVFDDKNTWKYIFSSGIDGKTAHIMLNGEVIKLALVSSTENEKLNTLSENYTSEEKNIEVEVIKQEIDNGHEHTSYKGEIAIRKAEKDKIFTFVGDCGV